jgi:hypothetical protein
MRTQRLGDVGKISDYSTTTIPKELQPSFQFFCFALFFFFLSFFLSSFPAILPSFLHILQEFYTPQKVAGKHNPLFNKQY